MTDKIVVLSTCGSTEEAEKIARELVENRLAACVNVISGVHSVYRWQGAVESATEALLLIKSSRDRFESLCGALQKMHSYQVPEVLALSVVEGSANYLNWLEGELRG
ncbi:MAG: divalent-cation tolerance protein CutA [Acidobacteria bacterium]|nr:divalent-cation tolerance protein CutA [Acidobacteriota bacterium]